MLAFRSLLRALRPLLLGALVAVAGSTAGEPARAAAAPTPEQLRALEAALNSSGDADLSTLLEAGPGMDPVQLEKRRRLLRKEFPNARWRLSAGQPLRDGRPTVTVLVTGSRQEGPTTYRLDAEQLLSLSSSGPRLNSQTVLRERSILRSGEEPLPVSLLIPDSVLTGQRYDVDVIFDDPLEGALTAGGIAALTPQQIAAMENPSIELGALGGGGIFKTVRAPLTPGFQTWAVLLVHPKGVVSATKRVRVVADRRLLEP